MTWLFLTLAHFLVGWLVARWYLHSQSAVSLWKHPKIHRFMATTFLVAWELWLVFGVLFAVWYVLIGRPTRREREVNPPE